MRKRPMLIITLAYIVGILGGVYLKKYITPLLNFIKNKNFYTVCTLFAILAVMCVLSVLCVNYFRNKKEIELSSESNADTVNIKLIPKRNINREDTILIHKNNSNNKDIKSKLKYNANRYAIIILAVISTLTSFTRVISSENKFNSLYNEINKDSKYIGVVVSNREESNYYYEYVVEIKNIDGDSKYNKTRVLLKIKKNKYNTYRGSGNFLANGNLLEYGDLIYGIGNFEKPETRRNYKGFDYAETLKVKNIYSICKSNYNDIKVVKKKTLNMYSIWLNNLKIKLENNLIQTLPEEYSSVAIALLLGNTKFVPDEQRDVFSNASLSHVLAISGMHVLFLLGALTAMLKKTSNRTSKYILIIFLVFFSQLTGSSPSVVRAVFMTCMVIISKLVYRKADTINNIAMSSLFILIINPYAISTLSFQLSFLGTLGIVFLYPKINFCIQRAILNKKYYKVLIIDKLEKRFPMLFLENIEDVESIRKAENTRNIGIFENVKKAENIRNTKNKLNIPNAKNIENMESTENKENFENIIKQNYKMLKYLIKIRKFLSEKIKIIIDKIVETIALSLSANILILPVLAYYFNTISFNFIISNIIVIPILGVMLFSGYITVIITVISAKFSKLSSIIFEISIKIFMAIANFSANINIFTFNTITPNIFIIFAYYFVIAYFLFLHKYVKEKVSKSVIIKVLSSTIIIVIGVHYFSTWNKGISIHFVDVGQGDCTLIITESNKKILIDGGGSETYNVGENTLLPYLLDRGINSIDYVMFSHFDSDHSLGITYFLENLDVSTVILSEQLVENDIYKHVLELAKEKNVRLLYVKAGDVLNIGDVKITILHPQKELMADNPMNNNSIVCKLEYKSFSVLFTGDIEKQAEELILSKNIDLRADVLKVPHHGSKTSSTQEFLNAVKPKVALIGVGKNNRYGHPSTEVLERFEYMGTRFFRTDENGEISIVVDKKGRIVKLEKCISAKGDGSFGHSKISKKNCPPLALSEGVPKLLTEL